MQLSRDHVNWQHVTTSSDHTKRPRQIITRDHVTFLNIVKVERERETERERQRGRTVCVREVESWGEGDMEFEKKK